MSYGLDYALKTLVEALTTLVKAYTEKLKNEV